MASGGCSGEGVALVRHDDEEVLVIVVMHDAEEFFARIEEMGIDTQFHTIAVHIQAEDVTTDFAEVEALAPREDLFGQEVLAGRKPLEVFAPRPQDLDDPVVEHDNDRTVARRGPLNRAGTVANLPDLHRESSGAAHFYDDRISTFDRTAADEESTLLLVDTEGGDRVESTARREIDVHAPEVREELEIAPAFESDDGLRDLGITNETSMDRLADKSTPSLVAGIEAGHEILKRDDHMGPRTLPDLRRIEDLVERRNLSLHLHLAGAQYRDFSNESL